MPARVGNEDVVDLDAHARRKRLDLGRELPVVERLEAVEERLDDERLDDDEDDADRRQGGRAHEPPTGAEAPRQPHGSGDRDGDEHGAEPERGQAVGQPAGPGLLGEPEVASTGERDRAEGKRCQPACGHDCQSDDRTDVHAPAADALEPRRERPCLPHGERQHRDLGRERGRTEAATCPGSRRSGRGGRREVVLRREVGEREVRDLGAPEQGRRNDPEHDRRDEGEGLR